MTCLPRLSGLPLPLAFAPFGFYGVPILCLAGLLLALENVSPRRAAWRGFLFGATSFLGGLYWVYVSIHVFGGAPLAFALFLMCLLVLFMATYPAAFAYLLNRFSAAPSLARYLLAAPALWVLIEWLRGWLFSGFGWLNVGYSQSDGLLAGLLPVLGQHGAAYALMLAAATCVALLMLAQTRRVAWLPAAAVALAAFGVGNVSWIASFGDDIRVALVQGAVPQDEKWLPGSLQPTVDLYLTLTDQHLDADLVIWPEAAIPTARHNLSGLFEALQKRGAQTNTDFLIGTVEVDRERDQRLNTVVSLRHDDPTIGRYVKRHLVPFGEYFPVPGFVREWMRWMELPYEDFTAGDPQQPSLVVANQTVGVSICYEDVFGDEMIRALGEASILVNVSNDAWFGGSIAPHQHLQIARVRAIEAGRMLLRGTNNGISAFIDADGTVLSQSPQFEPYVLEDAARGYRGATPYSRTGNWPVIALAFVAFGSAWFRAR